MATTRDADAELEALWLSDEEAAADLTVLIEELREDQGALEAMRIH